MRRAGFNGGLINVIASGASPAAAVAWKLVVYEEAGNATLMDSDLHARNGSRFQDGQHLTDERRPEDWSRDRVPADCISVMKRKVANYSSNLNPPWDDSPSFHPETPFEAGHAIPRLSVESRAYLCLI